MESQINQNIHELSKDQPRTCLKTKLLLPSSHKKAFSNDFIQEKSQFHSKDPIFSLHKSVTLNARKKKSPKKDEKNLECVYPQHIEVIEKIKKIKSLGQPLPFSPQTPPPILRNCHVAYGKKSGTLEKKIKERLENVEFILPEEPYSMDIFLKRIKETERVIRQENEFIYKIRKFKPKIQLKHTIKKDSKGSGKSRNRHCPRNKTPIALSRTGIVLASTIHV